MHNIASESGCQGVDGRGPGWANGQDRSMSPASPSVASSRPGAITQRQLAGITDGAGQVGARCPVQGNRRSHWTRSPVVSTGQPGEHRGRLPPGRHLRRPKTWPTGSDRRTQSSPSARLRHARALVGSLHLPGSAPGTDRARRSRLFSAHLPPREPRAQKSAVPASIKVILRSRALPGLRPGPSASSPRLRLQLDDDGLAHLPVA